MREPGEQVGLELGRRRAERPSAEILVDARSEQRCRPSGHRACPRDVGHEAAMAGLNPAFERELAQVGEQLVVARRQVGDGARHGRPDLPWRVRVRDGKVRQLLQVLDP